MSKKISPPPLKRRRLDTNTDSGDSPQAEQSHPPQLRIYSWNVNGIQPFIQRSINSFFQSAKKSKASAQDDDDDDGRPPPASLREFLRRYSFPTVLFLQEVKINPGDTTTIRAVERAVRALEKSDEPDYRAYFCLPSDKHNARGFGRKVYGVCSIVREDFLSEYNVKVRTVDWDLEGRFQILESDARPGLPRLSIWNIYAVNGTENPYRDPLTGNVAGTRHDRKLAVHRLMLDACKRLESEGFGVILAGDLNIARGALDGFPNLRTFPEQHVRNRLDFNTKFFDGSDGLRAIDSFRHLHDQQRRYTYYPHGGRFGYSCDRVDLIICSRSLEKRLQSSGMLDTAAERGTSDHCPLFAFFEIGETAPRPEIAGEADPEKPKTTEQGTVHLPKP